MPEDTDRYVEDKTKLPNDIDWDGPRWALNEDDVQIIDSPTEDPATWPPLFDVEEAIRQLREQGMADPIAVEEPPLGKGWEDVERDDKGRWWHGSGGTPDVKVTPVKERAWSGEPTETKESLGHKALGNLGENIIAAYMKSQGANDIRPLNVKVNNFPIDMMHDHEVIECKSGPVSNGRSGQQWRITLGEPAKSEKEWLKHASSEEKRLHNQKKMEHIVQRKQDKLEEYRKGSGAGKKAHGSTMTTIINLDKKTADIYKFPGFHQRVDWNSPMAAKAYVGTVKFSEK
jgi:hypothetical protein